MPEKVKMGMYLINEFEHENFDFGRYAQKEADLQDEYEILE